MNIAKFKDGLWRVECGTFTAGFVINNGHIVRCSPVLMKNFDNFAKFAIWISK